MSEEEFSFRKIADKSFNLFKNLNCLTRGIIYYVYSVSDYISGYPQILVQTLSEFE